MAGHSIFRQFATGRPDDEDKAELIEMAGNDDCSGCGLCAKECPVVAIDPNNQKDTVPDKCIICKRYIGICPKGARNVDLGLSCIFLKYSLPSRDI